NELKTLHCYDRKSPIEKIKRDWICYLTLKKTYAPLLHLISQYPIPWKRRMAQYFENFEVSLFKSALYRVCSNASLKIFVIFCARNNHEGYD
ncbi:MAG: hypothetical protein WC446_08940, partial [Candidatus Paceibacterota bacterium]